MIPRSIFAGILLLFTLSGVRSLIYDDRAGGTASGTSP